MPDITVTSIEDALDGGSISDVSITSFDGLPIVGGGGSGAVDSVNGETGVVVLSATDVGAQPVDSDLTAIAALATTTFGRSLLTAADAAAARTLTGAGTSSLAIGTTSSTAKAGDYQPAAANISDATTIGKAVLTAADAAAVRTAIGAGTSSLAIGTTGTTAAAGNDSRLSDARTPTAHAASHASAGSDPLTLSESQVTNLTTDLAAKVPTTRTVAGHALSADVTLVKGDVGLGSVDNTADTAKPVSTAQQTALDLKANLASPALTGTPTVPTATGGTNTTQAASTAFVAAAVSPLAPLASPTFTGTPAAPTVAGTSDSTTKISTTAFVQAVAALLAPLASPTFTGHPVGVTETAGNNSTRLASTAYADNAVAKQPEALTFALGDETTAITTGTKVTWRIPFAFTITEIRASLTTASSSGLPAFDVKKNGTTVFSTTVTIDATEKTSKTAVTAPVLSTTSLSDDDELTFIVNTAGTGAAGAKVTILGTRA